MGLFRVCSTVSGSSVFPKSSFLCSITPLQNGLNLKLTWELIHLPVFVIISHLLCSMGTWLQVELSSNKRLIHVNFKASLKFTTSTFLTLLLTFFNQHIFLNFTWLFIPKNWKHISLILIIISSWGRGMFIRKNVSMDSAKVLITLTFPITVRFLLARDLNKFLIFYTIPL